MSLIGALVVQTFAPETVQRQVAQARRLVDLYDQ
jgi:hypothetical protein